MLFPGLYILAYSCMAFCWFFMANIFCLQDVGTTSFHCPLPSCSREPWGVNPNAFRFHRRLTRWIVSWTIRFSFWAPRHSGSFPLSSTDDGVSIAIFYGGSSWGASSFPSSFALLILNNASAKMLAFLGWYVVIGCFFWKNPSRIYLI